MDGCEVKIMGTAMFHMPIWTILLVVIHSSKNKVEKVDDFGVILMEFSSPTWQKIFKFNNTVYGKSLLITSYAWACKVLLSSLLHASGTKKKNISNISSELCNFWNLVIIMLSQMTWNKRKLIDMYCESVLWRTE